MPLYERAFKAFLARKSGGKFKGYHASILSIAATKNTLR